MSQRLIEMVLLPNPKEPIGFIGKRPIFPIVGASPEGDSGEDKDKDKTDSTSAGSSGSGDAGK